MKEKIVKTMLKELRDFRTEEENKKYIFYYIKNFKKEQLISSPILKVCNLTERVKALEK